MRVLLVILFLCFSPFSYADGNEFLSKCKSTLGLLDLESPEREENFIVVGYCLGKVQGVRDMNFVYEVLKGKDNVYFCIPEQATESPPVI